MAQYGHHGKNIKDVPFSLLFPSSDSTDPRIAAALHFAQQVVQNQGHVSDEDVAEVRQAGYGDAEIAEIVGHVALNVLTNYFNTVAQTVVDFPKTGKLVPSRS